MALPALSTPQDALDARFTRRSSTVYVGGVTVDAATWDALAGDADHLGAALPRRFHALENRLRLAGVGDGDEHVVTFHMDVRLARGQKLAAVLIASR